MITPDTKEIYLSLEDIIVLLRGYDIQIPRPNLAGDNPTEFIIRKYGVD